MIFQITMRFFFCSLSDILSVSLAVFCLYLVFSVLIYLSLAA